MGSFTRADDGVATASQPPAYARPFNSSRSLRASTGTQRRRHQDPYAIAQAKARKAANLSRQEVLKRERAANLGDPVRGITTPYVRSFDTAAAAAPEAKNSSTPLPKHPESETAIPREPTDTASASQEQLNHFLTKPELDAGLRYSQWLSNPSTQPEDTDVRDYTDERTPEERAAVLKNEQETAAEALRRISQLSIGSSKDRMRVNVQRCIQDFGRHTTDNSLPPRPAAAQPLPANQLPKTPRVGPDTGSSEVQIAILTAKIRTLADFLETRGSMDKANKRNLRLLVHRRAKLLNYLRRKERGGPRFQNVVDTLGLTEGTWKGEITIMGPLGGHSAVRLAKLQAKA